MKNTMTIEFVGLLQNVSVVRTAVACFASSLEPTLEEIADIRTAVSEAVTNAIVHGYRGAEGIVTAECRIDGSELTVEVSDAGCGIEDVELAMQPFYTSGPEEERTGIGFAVMDAFMDSLEVVSKPGRGTKVTMTKRILSNKTADQERRQNE